MELRLYCPILRYEENGKWFLDYCRRKRCAWYIKERKVCALKDLAQSLDYITRNLTDGLTIYSSKIE